MSGGAQNPQGTNGTLNAPGSGGITNMPGYGSGLQQFMDIGGLFPRPMPDNSAPSQLPSLGIMPQYYDPNSFGGYAKLGPGQFNAMASHMAGRQYVPTMMKGKPLPVQHVVAAAAPSGSGGSSTLVKMLAGGLAGSLLPGPAGGSLGGLF